MDTFYTFGTVFCLLILALLAYVLNREAAVRFAWSVAITLAIIVGILIILRIGLSPLVG